MMEDFEALYEKFEKLDQKEYYGLITEKSEKIMDAMKDLVVDDLTGPEIFFEFILCSVAADGKLAKEEYEFIYPMLEALFGEAMNYDEANYWFKNMGLSIPEEFNYTVEMLVKVMKGFSPELKNDVLLVCMMICAIDGNVSPEEKELMKKLAQ